MPTPDASRREFLKALGLGAVALAVPGCASTNSKGSMSGSKAAPPNFVFILGDDQGWSNSSVQMDPEWSLSASDYIVTPTFERMAKEGMRFTNAYAPAAMCSPTRYGIQFGKTPVRLLKTDNYGPDEESMKRIEESTTIPQMLKASGLDYVTAHIGKWHISPGPGELGYDFHDGSTNNPDGSLLTRGNREKGIEPVPLPEDDPKRIFSLTRRANAFMEEQVTAGRPFYLQLSHYAVHVRLMALEETLEKYEKKPRGKWHHDALYAACSEDLDTGVGMLIDKIHELGIADNTYIIYMADNGAEAIRGNRHLRNMPLRRGKFSFFEGGVRVPMFAMGPGIKPGSVCKTPVWGCDLLPTLHDFSGSREPMPREIDGGSLREVFAEPENGKVKRKNIEGLVFHCARGMGWSGTRRQSAIRLGSYKLIKNYYNDEELLLFDLDQDPYEWNNLAETMPEKRDELHRKMTAYLQKVKARNARLTEDELYQMAHPLESVANKTELKSWGWSRPDSISEYPIESFSEAEKNPAPYEHGVEPK